VTNGARSVDWRVERGLREVVLPESIVVPITRGECRIEVLGPGLLLGHASGVFDRKGIEVVMRHTERSATGNRVTTFFDASELHSFDGDARDYAGTWLKSTSLDVRTHILVGSKLVELALQVIALFSGKRGLEVYADRSKWEAALQGEKSALPSAYSKRF
jgi:hypothetical protein